MKEILLNYNGKCPLQSGAFHLGGDTDVDANVTRPLEYRRRQMRIILQTRNTLCHRLLVSTNSMLRHPPPRGFERELVKFFNFGLASANSNIEFAFSLGMSLCHKTLTIFSGTCIVSLPPSDPMHVLNNIVNTLWHSDIQREKRELVM